MTNSGIKIKKKKRKSSPEDMKQLKEQQKLLYLRQRRKMRQHQMMLHRIKSLFKLGNIVAFFLVFIYLIMIPQWKLSPFIFSQYPNPNLTLQDNLITKDAQIIDTLKKIKVPDKPLFMINPKEFERALLKLDPVKKVYIRRYWLPARLNVVIVEKQPIFMVKSTLNQQPLYAVTAEGSTIGKKFLPLPPEFDAKTFNLIIPNLKIKWDKTLANKYYDIALITEKTTDEKLQYIDLSNPKDIYIRTASYNIRIGEIDANVVERLSRLQVIIPKITDIKTNLAYIDLRWDKAVTLKQNVSLKTLETQAKIRQEKLEEKEKQEAEQTAKQNMLLIQENESRENSNLQTTENSTQNQPAQKPEDNKPVNDSGILNNLPN